MKSWTHALVALGFALVSTAVLGAGEPLAAQEPAEPGPIPDHIVSPASVGEVDFPHRSHVEDYGFDCVECHHETRAAALATPHPQYLQDSAVECAACHGAATPLAARSCSACHGATVATIASDSLSAKVAVHRTCWRCHESSTGADASASCSLCHRAGTPAAAAAAPRGR